MRLVLALEHYGNRFRTHSRSSSVKIKGIKLSARSKAAGVKTGVSAGAIPGAVTGAQKNFPTVLKVQCKTVVLLWNI